MSTTARHDPENRLARAGLADASRRLRLAIERASRGLVERELVVELVVLAAVAREHLLVIGPPGTAKSEAVRRVARGIDGRVFEYLVGRFTEPSEIFGAVDLQKLRAGRVETDTHGMLPEADLAFLDEVFLGSTAILNSLLGVLNERRFRRGHSDIACPLRVCVGASNALPEDPTLAAFADRFLLHVFVQPIPDPALEDLLAAGASLQRDALGPPPASVADIDVLVEAARVADTSALRPRLAEVVRTLRDAGIALTDRRIVKAQALTAAAAVLAGRADPTPADLWPLLYVVPSAEGQALARDALREVFAHAHNPALPAAALDASQGPHARAERIARLGEALLAEVPSAAGADGRDALRAWRLRVEGIAREIDASFAADARPAPIATLRARIVKVLGDSA
ncbi:MAG: AAA family ATPase [Myxococcota bacterium]